MNFFYLGSKCTRGMWVVLECDECVFLDRLQFLAWSRRPFFAVGLAIWSCSDEVVSARARFELFSSSCSRSTSSPATSSLSDSGILSTEKFPSPKLGFSGSSCELGSLCRIFNWKFRQTKNLTKSKDLESQLPFLHWPFVELQQSTGNIHGSGNHRLIEYYRSVHPSAVPKIRIRNRRKNR